LSESYESEIILTEDFYYDVGWELWIREKYSQRTCTRTLGESYESERNTHRGLVLGRWERAMNQREILTEDFYLDLEESINKREILTEDFCLDLEWEYKSERNTHRGLVQGRWVRAMIQREILTEDLYLDVWWEL
jgi:hypothetical protein